MARPIRYIPPGSTVEVTTRTIQSRFLLRPSQLLNAIIIGILGRALERHPIKLHYFVVLSNHVHLLLTVPNGRALAKFMNYVNSKIAREAGRLCGWRARFWGRRYSAICVLDESAMVARLRYLMAHGCKEFLVQRPEDWPGANALRAVVNGEPLVGTWIDRTAACRSGRNALAHLVEYQVRISPLPCWGYLPRMEVQRRCGELLADIKAAVKREIGERGCSPIGAALVCRKAPESRPATTKRSPAPLCHASNRQTRDAYRREYQEFAAAYRTASARFRAGDTGIEFPPHCFPPSLPFSTGPANRAPPQASHAAP
jgi:REP element-mobilizing transposase RayT